MSRRTHFFMLYVQLTFIVFCENDGNSMGLEERISNVLSLNLWPISLIGEDNEVVDCCNDEQELREILQKHSIL